MITKIIQPILLSIFFILPFNINAAVTIVQCEDAQGNKSFEKTCPPGSRQVDKKRIVTKQEPSSEAIDLNATLYVIPDCEACDEVKEFLTDRNITISEKDISNNAELQKELLDITGNLQVPVTIIGEDVVTGYSRSKFLNTLKAAGYKEID